MAAGGGPVTYAVFPEAPDDGHTPSPTRWTWQARRAAACGTCGVRFRGGRPRIGAARRRTRL